MHAMELIEMSKQTQQEDKNSLGRSKQMIAQTQEVSKMSIKYQIMTIICQLSRSDRSNDISKVEGAA